MSLRIAANTVEAVLERYQHELSTICSSGEVRAMARAVFQDRFGWDAAELLLRRTEPLSEQELLQVYQPLDRLRRGEPLQYVLGSVVFHGLQLRVDPTVLIPRPETEELLDLMIRSFSKPPRRILDIGTGSGCIALALKKRFHVSHVIGMDVSAAALSTAALNARENGLEVEWMQADVLAVEALPPSDLIVSNPPYVPRSEEAAMERNVRDFEPHLALFVEDLDPLLFYRVIGQKAMHALPMGGELWYEGHHVHIRDVVPLLHGLGYAHVELIKDLSGSDRFIRARK